jgi:uncharacterized protein (DUF433 family)
LYLIAGWYRKRLGRMIPDPLTMIIPLHMDEHGAIRVSGTRVTLDTVIARYHQGDSPEAIHESFDVLPLNDIYAVIAYYLAHRDEMDVYLQRREADAARIRQEWEAKYPPKITKAELLQRLEARKNEQDG